MDYYSSCGLLLLLLAQVGFHDALNAVFALINNTVLYDQSLKGWVFPLSQYKYVMDALTDGRLHTRGVHVTMQQVRRLTWRMFFGDHDGD